MIEWDPLPGMELVLEQIGLESMLESIEQQSAMLPAHYSMSAVRRP